MAIGVIYQPDPDDVEGIVMFIEIMKAREETFSDHTNAHWEAKRLRQKWEARLVELDAEDCYAVIDDVKNIISVYKKSDHKLALVPTRVTGMVEPDSDIIREHMEREAPKLGFKITEWQVY